MTKLNGSERVRYLQTMFTRIAHRYDFMNRLMTGGQDVKWRKEVIRLAQIKPSSALLDLGTGTGDLAREALKRQGEHATQAAEFTKQTQLQKDAVEKLKDQLRTLNDKIEEAKRKKNILIARQKRAEAQKAIQDTMQGLSDTSAFDTFERMAQKVDQIEAESEASAELGSELAGDTLQQKFKALETGSVGTDTALAELKAKMGLAPLPEAKAALPAQVKQDESKIPSVLTTENRNK